MTESVACAQTWLLCATGVMGTIFMVVATSVLTKVALQRDIRQALTPVRTCSVPASLPDW